MSGLTGRIAARPPLGESPLRAVSDNVPLLQERGCCAAENGGLEPKVPNFCLAAKVRSRETGRMKRVHYPPFQVSCTRRPMPMKMPIENQAVIRS